ncbi:MULTISPECIES: formylmethanofuran dehydrogenase [unclassified Variovorax]|uniref:formylmethanofuran dehydrogenase n=1 Tax=unclassified Variovorax TaxID=663243 RepID=UPI00210C504D|nr:MULTISPECIES: formylmethanofuran dehydrogenase [unclassified Variovorax]
MCVLLCDDLGARVGASLELVEGDCPSAREGLARFPASPSTARPQVGGKDCEVADAVAEACRILAGSGQPLFGGLGTDVAGARALYRLACATGAICDAANGDALMLGVRALQDRGGFSTTLAEVRNRADLIVCVGGLPAGDAAGFFDRCGVGEAVVPQRHVVLLGGDAGEVDALAAWGARPGVTTESVPLLGDLFGTLALLAARVAGRAAREAPPALEALAKRLLAARYAVIVGQTDRLPTQGDLVIETVGRIVAKLNAGTRAAAMWLGGGNGARTVNEVFTWLSGLPLRSRAGPGGLEHEPLCFDTQRLLDEGAVDSLLWVSSFDAGCVPPPTALPLIVLGHPGLAPAAARPGGVFIPVSTPGIGSPGHLIRTDGGAVLPLAALYRDTLPTLDHVLVELTQAVRSERARSAT